jgi:hypothetical protein
MWSINFDTAIRMASGNPQITTADQAQRIAELLRFPHVTTLTARLHMRGKGGRGFETAQAADAVVFNALVNSGSKMFCD